MKSITLKTPAGTVFEIHAYKAGETVEIFKGATGVFGKGAGSKTAGIVYVRKGDDGMQAEDQDVDNASFWEWVQLYMQRGIDRDIK